jgi:Rrf2 family transcriptional regulator, cysteine metabolism repressor
MKLSLASTYALHALVHLANRKPDQSVPSHVIAQSDGTPERFLLKILKPLVTADILHAIKGPHGGYRLARRPQNISVLEVIEAVDGPISGQAPLLGTGATALDRRLEAVCQQVAAVVRGILRKVSIKDLAGKAT